MVKRVLMVAFHYPPVAGSSGVHRVRSFAKYLPEYGWEPIVLTVSPFAYAKRSNESYADSTEVVRAPCLDAARHFSIRGRYPSFMGWPDRWSTWWFTGVPAGLALIKRRKPDLMWSTYPTATAHLIALTLHRLTGLKWLADFRDSMTEPDYPENARLRAIFRWIEERTIAGAAGAIFTAPGAVRMYRERYEYRSPDFWHRISNGYDENVFAAAGPTPPTKSRDRKLSLLHAGILYPSERDPRPFFSAVARLKERGAVTASELQIKLRATGYDEVHRRHIQERGISDIVQLLPIIPYREAVMEMMGEDALLLFQAPNCNRQIPAKLYEYLRTGKPILAITDPSGDTAAELANFGIDSIVDIEDEESIIRGLDVFLRRVRSSNVPKAPPDGVEHFSRRTQTAELARLFDCVAEPRSARRPT